ncbi:MAG: F0F1 ATP synthase subunit A [Streptococcaceae bacterium]|nr:F0F1 ATP synthase subunit A [Streptococcaceae bacterium]MCH4176076.1 F0F1 ATP synthase subunit A [Streptococcaceae bacterium]
MSEKSWIFPIGPLYFDGTVLIMVVLTCAIVFGLIYWASRNMQLRPKGKQNVLEYLVEFVGGTIKDNLPAKELNNFHLLGFVLFAFLLVANNIGLVTHIVVGDDITLWKSPTADPIVTMTLAGMVLLMGHFLSVQRFGFKTYLVNSFAKPLPFLLPIKILEEFTNLLTLSLRLYGNIYAGEVLLSLVANLGVSHGILVTPVAILLEMVWIGFSIFISCIQAYIFVTLTMVYTSHKVVLEEE